MYKILSSIQEPNKEVLKTVAVFSTYESAKNAFEKLTRETADDLGYPSEELTFNNSFGDVCGNVCIHISISNNYMRSILTNDDGFCHRIVFDEYQLGEFV